MASSTVVAARRWYFDLANRERDHRLFLIPRTVVEAAGISWNSKRRVSVVLSTGRRLGGFCTITSGTELSIPAHLKQDVREAGWFGCEIVGDETAEIAPLDRLL